MPEMVLTPRTTVSQSPCRQVILQHGVGARAADVEVIAVDQKVYRRLQKRAGSDLALQLAAPRTAPQIVDLDAIPGLVGDVERVTDNHHIAHGMGDFHPLRMLPRRIRGKSDVQALGHTQARRRMLRRGRELADRRSNDGSAEKHRLLQTGQVSGNRQGSAWFLPGQRLQAGDDIAVLA
jgi:hypothetical protein